MASSTKADKSPKQAKTTLTAAQQKRIDADLAKAGALTDRLREIERQADEVKSDRRIVFARLRKAGVTAQRIADTCGITDAAVHATLRLK